MMSMPRACMSSNLDDFHDTKAEALPTFSAYSTIEDGDEEGEIFRL